MGSGAVVLWLVIVCLFISSLCFRACFTNERSGSHLPVGPLNNVWPYIVVSGWLAGLAFFWWSGAVVEGQRIGGPQSLPALQKQGAQFAGSFFAAVTDSAE